MTKDELNNTVIDALKHGSELNKTIINTIEEMLKTGDNFSVNAILVGGYGVPVTIVRRHSNYQANESHFEVCLSPELASGTFGSVYQSSLLVKADANGEIYETAPSSKAVKLMKRQEVPNEDSILEKEKTVISDLNPNMNKPENIRQGRAHLIKFKSDKPYEGAFVMPYIKGEELLKYLGDNWSKLSYEMRVVIADKIIAAVDDFHIMTGKVHQDLKFENLMFDPVTLEVTVIDFGMAEKIGTLKTITCGSPNFIAPEATKVKNEEIFHHPNQDYFAVGGMLAMLFGSSNSWERVNNTNNAWYQMGNKTFDISDLFRGMQPPVEEARSIIDHITALTRIDPNRRTQDIEEISGYFYNLAKSKVEIICEQLAATIADVQIGVDAMNSSAYYQNTSEQYSEYNISVGPITFEKMPIDSDVAQDKKTRNMHSFFNHISPKLEKSLANKHGDKKEILENFKNQLEAAEIELLGNPTIEGYNIAYAQVQKAVDSLDADTMAKLNEFRTRSIKSVVASLTKPIAWLLGKDSLVHTTSANLAHDIKDEFRVMAQESGELPRLGC